MRFKILNFLSFIPDTFMLRMQYRIKQGKKLNLDNPELFTEKIQWLKLHNRKDIYHSWIDKYAVKDYVASIIGEEYIIPTLGYWNNFDEINFETLPNQFVLKTNIGGGGLNVVVCRDKSKLDFEDARKKLVLTSKVTGVSFGREWPYEGVKTCIIAEKLMQNANDSDLKDYKFFCFNGEPHYCQVIGDRSTDETIDFYDRNWNHQEFIGLNLEARHANTLAERPKNLSLMQDIARKLSEGQPFLRVDLYEINGKVYFGEITFYPASGYGTFRPSEWDKKLGDLIELSLLNNGE